MNKLKLTIILIIVLLLLFFSIGGFPLIIEHDKKQIINTNNTKIFNPLTIEKDLEYDKIVLLIDWDDWNNLPKNLAKRRVLICTNNNILEQFKKYFIFEQKKGDMATVTSKIIIFNEKQIVLESNIILDKHYIGIQGEKTGYAQSIHTKELYELFVQFKPYRKFILDI